MFLIADSGSTKTIWACVQVDVKPIVFQSKGYNPFHVNSEDIVADLKMYLPNNLEVRNIQHVFFYGAGCNEYADLSIIRRAILQLFPNAKVHIESDLLCAAIALFGNNKGIVCVSGTGSAAALWDGEKLQQFTPSLGYILGDEGSAAYMGIRFVQKYLRNEFDNETMSFFSENLRMTHGEILEKVYQSQDVKRFLASFTPLMLSRIKDIGVKQIVEDAYRRFIEVFIQNIPDYKNYPIGFIGSTAFFLKEIIEQVFIEYDLSVWKVLMNPLEELVSYHTNKMF
jgi:glucosamine kinase